MKKTLLFLALAGALSAASIDLSGAKVSFDGYKTQAKTAVPGSFKDVKFDFAKTDGQISEILSGAVANIDFKNLETGLPIRNKNILDKLVKFMQTSEIKAEFLSASGDDAKGEIKAQITMNGVTKPVDMSYVVENGTLTASGMINQLDFMPEAFDKFKNDKVIQGLHAKLTHPEVKVIFQAPVK